MTPKAEPLTSEELASMKALDDKLWRRMKDRWFTHSFPEGVMTAEEEAFVVGLLLQKELPVVMTSGVYGDLGMRVYDHSDVPMAAIAHAVSIHSDHFASLKDKSWDEKFEFLSRFTHSRRNREVLRFYGFPEPGHKSDYEY